MSEWYEAEDPLDSGVKLPSATIDWAWRKSAAVYLRSRGDSLRVIAKKLGVSHEKVRSLLVNP